ncbi:MAG: hypothetical protein JJE05_05165 [Actinobacteria bacterium]|nr:hypothetical protein [Actinomycetota bacterium]
MAVRRKLVVVLTGAMVALGSFQVVSAHEFTAKSHVSIKVTKKGFKGSVSSEEDSCLEGRKVVLLKKRNDKKVDSTHTDGSGDWTIRVPDAAGKYYAKVTRSIDEYQDEYHHLHDCQGNESDTAQA